MSLDKGNYSMRLDDFCKLRSAIYVLFLQSILNAVPTGLTAFPGNGMVTLVWKRDANATSYKIYRSTTPDITNPTLINANVTQRSLPKAFGGTVVASPTEEDCGVTVINALFVDFSDSTVTNGITYYYKVSSDNESIKSTEVTVKPEAFPKAISKNRYLKILPLGDSHTAGYAGSCNLGGYRDTLSKLLSADGFKFSFVGSNTRNSNMSKPNPFHEGWHGREASDLLKDVIDRVITNFKPDIILLEIGTNSLAWTEDGYRFDHADEYFDTLVTKIFSLHPGTHVLVSPIPPATTQAKTAQFNTYNDKIRAIVENKKAQGKNITWVSGFDSLKYEPTDFTDFVHASSVGYRKQGVVWFEAIKMLTNGTSVRFTQRNKTRHTEMFQRQGTTIKANTISKSAEFNLFSLSGKVVYHSTLSQSNSINLKNKLNYGLYITVLKDRQTKFQSRLHFVN